jgi:hypothetical protein
MSSWNLSRTIQLHQSARLTRRASQKLGLVSQTGAIGDYTVRGNLRIATQLGPYAWTVLPGDKPDAPRGWKGMSGSAPCRTGTDEKLYLFGAVQEIPADFSKGLLEVACLLFPSADATRNCVTSMSGS